MEVFGILVNILQPLNPGPLILGSLSFSNLLQNPWLNWIFAKVLTSVRGLWNV